MTLKGKHALVTGVRGASAGASRSSSRRAGRGSAIHYHVNETAAKETLEGVRKHGADGVPRPGRRHARRRRCGACSRSEAGFGALDVLVANARPELATFYQKPMEHHARGVGPGDGLPGQGLPRRRPAGGPPDDAGGRIVALTYAPGAQKGTWQPWVAMGVGKAAMESLVRYFAVALAPRGITVNSLSPGLTDDSVFNGLPDEVQEIGRKWHASGWTPMGRMGTPADIGNAVALLCSPDSGWITGQLIYADGGASLVDTLMPLEIQRG